VLESSSYLSATEFGSFTPSVDDTSSLPPYDGLLGPDSPVWARTFVKSRVRGALTRLTLAASFVRYDKALAKRLNYPMSVLPIVPLTGPIVASNAGLLEVYQTHDVFLSPAGVTSDVDSIRASDGGIGGSKTVAVSPPAIPYGRVLYEFYGTMGPAARNVEHVVGVEIGLGAILIQLSFQGGSAVTPDSVVGWVVMASRRSGQCQSA
jgi:hypothetical protein